MKIILGKQRQRGWVLWAFIVVVACAIVLAKVIVDFNNIKHEPYDPDIPDAPPADTNNAPSTNPPPKLDIAMFFIVAEGDGDPPLIASITYGLMPVGDGVAVAIVDQTAPSLTPPQPIDDATYSNRVVAWQENWGILVDGSMGADWSKIGYSPYAYDTDGLYHWQYLTADQPGAPITLMDSNSFTYTAATFANTNAYSVTIQRLDAAMSNPTNLDTKTMTPGQFQTFIDWGAPTNAAFYRVSYRPK